VWVITRAVGTTCDPESDGKAIYHLLLTVRTNIRSLLADSPRAGSIGGATSRAPATSLRGACCCAGSLAYWSQRDILDNDFLANKPHDGPELRFAAIGQGQNGIRHEAEGVFPRAHTRQAVVGASKGALTGSDLMANQVTEVVQLKLCFCRKALNTLRLEKAMSRPMPIGAWGEVPRARAGPP
jgi:hypothetical protein